MRILVPIRQTVDHNVIVRPLSDGAGPDVAGAPRAINPFDEIALEAALQLKEKGAANEVIACAIGPASVEKALRTALAMGADEAVWVQADDFPAPPDVAALLAVLAQARDMALVLMGKQEIEGDFGVVAQMLAGRLGWPQALFAADIRPAGEEALEVVCERDAGTRTVRLPLPAVVSADLRLAEPRFVSLPNLMKAKRRPIETVTAAELGVSLASRMEVLHVQAAPGEREGRMVGSVDALLDCLRERGVALKESEA